MSIVFRRPISAALVVLGNALLLALIAALFRWPSLGKYAGLEYLTLGVFALAGAGMCWMIYDAMRYEKRPWLYILLSLIPYWFVWHYFQRARRRTWAEQRPMAFR